MKKHICHRCKKQFKQKSHLTDHLNRKNPCEEVILDDNDDDIHMNRNTTSENHLESFINRNELKKNQCEFCFKEFPTNSNYNRHIKICKKKPEKKIDDYERFEFMKLIEEQNKIIRELMHNNQENNMIKKNQCEFCYKIFSNNSNYNKHKKVCKGNPVTYNNCNQSTNTQNININLSPFGKEDLTHLEGELFDLVRYFNYKTVYDMIEGTHFDKRKPQNHNIYVPNIKNKYAAIYNGEKWNLVNSDEIIDDMIKKNYYILEDFYNDNIEQLDELKYKDSKAYDRFIDFLSIINDADREHEKAYVKGDVYLSLYNNRDVPLKTKKRNVIEL